MKRNFRELSVLAALALLLIALALFTPNFFEPQPLLSRLTAAAPKLILACGVAIIIIARQIDISIGSLFAVCGSCAGLFCPIYIQQTTRQSFDLFVPQDFDGQDACRRARR